MNLAYIRARSAVGIWAQSVSVEVHLSNGLPAFTIVGLAETAVKESKDRVRSAIINSQFEFPCRRITVNLAPANVPKTGSGFDLPIAIGILAASGQIPLNGLDGHEFMAELALCGNLRGVSAIIPAVLAARRDGQNIIIAAANGGEAAITTYKGAFLATSLRQVCDYLCQGTPLEPLPKPLKTADEACQIDWSDVRGQAHAKQAMMIAAAGGHSILLSGPPGSGKTMLAKRFQTLLPDLSETAAMECAAIHSIRGQLPDYRNWQRPPFRAPHHTASQVALVGGGNPPGPGEISLAHHGVLFLDELPEFGRHVLETLRQPLEAGSVCISRAAIQSEFPAKIQLIAAMNPCPCGHWGNPQANCLCSPDRISRYLGKLSAPLLDRIDMQVQVQALPGEELIKPHHPAADESLTIRQQVQLVRERQTSRQGCLNAHLSSKASEEVCALEHEERNFMGEVMSKLRISARAYHRLLKVARTLADLAEKERVSLTELKQALAFRQTLEAPK